MTENETNTDRTRRAYAAFAAGDLITLRELMSPDAVWIVGGDNALSGTYHGRDATFDYFGKLLEATEGTLRTALMQVFEVVPDTVIPLVHVNATAHGITYDEEVVQQLHLRNGVAIACRTFVENGHLWDALVGPKQIVLPVQGAGVARV